MGIAREGGWVGVKACQDGSGHFFPTFARWCKGLPGWFGALFFHVCPFDRGGGGLKLFGQYPYRANIFQKVASLTSSTLCSEFSHFPGIEQGHTGGLRQFIFSGS